MKLLGLVLGGMLLTMVSAGCVLVSPKSVTRTESLIVPSPYHLAVDTFNGSVDVTRTDSGAVGVTATIRQPDDVTYGVVLDGDTLRITATAKRTNISPSPGVSLVITAPPDAVLDLKTSNGHVSVMGVGTSGSVESSNGLIHLEDLQGQFTLHSSNGALALINVTGAFDASTSNGKIDFDGTFAPDSSSQLDTSNGQISITLGNNPSVQLKADTSNGRISVSQTLSNASVSTNHVEGTIGTGSATLTLRTSSGDIDIR